MNAPREEQLKQLEDALARSGPNSPEVQKLLQTIATESPHLAPAAIILAARAGVTRNEPTSPGGASLRNWSLLLLGAIGLLVAGNQAGKVGDLSQLLTSLNAWQPTTYLTGVIWIAVAGAIGGFANSIAANGAIPWPVQQSVDGKPYFSLGFLTNMLIGAIAAYLTVSPDGSLMFPGITPKPPAAQAPAAPVNDTAKPAPASPPFQFNPGSLFSALLAGFLGGRVLTDWGGKNIWLDIVRKTLGAEARPEEVPNITNNKLPQDILRRLNDILAASEAGLPSALPPPPTLPPPAAPPVAVPRLPDAVANARSLLHQDRTLKFLRARAAEKLPAFISRDGSNIRLELVEAPEVPEAIRDKLHDLALIQVDNTVDGFFAQCQNRGLDVNAASASLQSLWKRAMALKKALADIPADFLFNEEALR